jgi:hypothetical protein
MTQEETADRLVVALAAALVPLAESRDTKPAPREPMALPDLISALLRVAHGIPGFAARAMQGQVPPQEWQKLGDLLGDLAVLCRRQASTIDS